MDELLVAEAAPTLADTDVAVVGMAGRFPGAPDVDALWARVSSGDDCLRDLAEADLVRAGVDASTFSSPEYVRRTGAIDGVDLFDPGFFGIGRRDAAIMDPQHRILLECVWEALESAGHVPETFPGSIGIFAGCGANTYLLHNLLSNRELVDQLGWFLLRHTGNDKDFLATGISYRLDLRGPSINVQTACSTSLVAVHLAVQSLLAFECDLAVAGGATIEVPHGVGYRYHEGEILSATGRCRAFDAESDGTVLTSGAGAVVLRRAVDAWRDRDPILAVIKGSAVNNDGARKVGFLAPSVDGHADVVREALAVAGVDARTVTLLEAHGTGTAVGDPIEVAALTEAFRTHTSEQGFCRLASTKANIGHLDTAAGVASLVKVVQALRHRELPPLANHTGPNPLLDLAGSPFVLSGSAAPWTVDGPRRAGVSSLGVGGTNAHVVVEEAPPAPLARAGAPEQVLVLSARSETALAEVAERLARHLEQQLATDLADVAHTLATGRRSFSHRRVVVARDTDDAVTRLRQPDRRRSYSATATGDEPAVGFLFPGGGSQYPGMTAGLDARFEEFHRTLAEGMSAVHELSGIDLRRSFQPDADVDEMRRPEVSLPSVFLVGVALARQWMAWGVQPRALVGHSLGEYTAAHVAGVLSFTDALRVVTTRALLMARVGGDGTAMLSVPLPASDVERTLPASLSLAVVNAADECVVAGSACEIRRLSAALEARGLTPTIVPIAVAAHSRLLDPILPEFTTFMEGIPLRAPQIPYVSNLTGTWITEDEAVSPQYWARHLRGTVRFADCLATVLGSGPFVLTELGPGHSLSSYARRHEAAAVGVVPALRHPGDACDDTTHTLGAFARLWAHGVSCDPTVTTGGERRRLRLPTSPFERERHWIEPGAGAGALTGTGVAVARPASRPPAAPPFERIPDLADWAWTRSWVELGPPGAAPATGPWLVLADEGDGFGAAIVTGLRATGEQAVGNPSFDPSVVERFRNVCVVAPSDDREGSVEERFERARARLLTDATKALRHLAAQGQSARFVVVTRGALDATGRATRPEQALALGPVLVAPREYDDLDAVLVDVDAATEVERVVAEIVGRTDPIVSLGGGHCRTVETERRRLEPASAPAFRRGGTYVVTGGLGQIGFTVAEHLARTHGADLAVISSEALPPAGEQARFVATHGSAHPTSRRLRRLESLASHGGRVEVIGADLSRPAEVRRALDEVEERFGHIDGVVHAAGRLVDDLLEAVTEDGQEAVVGVKARAAAVLADELARRGGTQLLLMSSTSSALAPAGQSSYVAASAVLDALAGTAGDLQVTTVGFGVWSGGGMAVEAASRAELGLRPGARVDHPVLSEHAVDATGRHVYTGALDACADWVVDGHRVGSGRAVLPGTGHLELMLAALALAGLPASLADVSLLSPLVVVDGSPVLVRVTVDPADEHGARAVRIESDRGEGRAWSLHSEAEHRCHLEPPSDIEAVDAAASTTIDPLAGQRRHLLLGRRWDGIVQATASHTVVEATIELPPEFREETASWVAHPAVADLAVACAAALGAPSGDALYVPVGFEAVMSTAPLAGQVVARARARPSTRDDLVRADIRIEDACGGLLLVIEGLALKGITAPVDFAAGAAPITSPGRAEVPVLLDAARTLGIRPAEGVELVERVLASGSPYVLVSSLSLDQLRQIGHREPAPVDGVAVGAADGAGQGGLVGIVTGIFEELLGVSPVAPGDDFFELGGHSLIAIRLLSRVQKATGVRVPLAALFEVPSPQSLADRLVAEKPELAGPGAASPARDGVDRVASVAAGSSPGRGSALPPSLVPVRAGGARRPLFVVHGAGGNVLNLWGLAKHLPADRPVYGLQAHGIDGATAPDPTVEAMASRYVAAVQALQPDGPYLLGGYSGGGVVALEMTRQLQRQGQQVPIVVLLDTIPRDSERPRAARRYRNALGHAGRRGLAAVAPYAKYSLGLRFGLIPHDIEGLGLGFGDTSEYGVVNLADHFEAVIDAYGFGTYDVDVVIAKAEKVYPAWPWHYGWKGRILGRIDTVVCPGNHFEMFTSENAPVLARLIEPFLDAADGG